MESQTTQAIEGTSLNEALNQAQRNPLSDADNAEEIAVRDAWVPPSMLLQQSLPTEELKFFTEFLRRNRDL